MAHKNMVQGTMGDVPCTILTEFADPNGKKFLLIDVGVGAYCRGVFTRYLSVPKSLVNVQLDDMVEIVD